MDHDTLKKIGRVILRDIGFADYEITEEFPVLIDGKKYVVDLVGISKNRRDEKGRIWDTYKTAIECGQTSYQKLQDLKKYFNLTLHITKDNIVEWYWQLVSGKLNLQEWVGDRLNEYNSKIVFLEERLKHLEHEIYKLNQKLERMRKKNE